MSVSSRSGQSEYCLTHCCHFRGENLYMKFNQSNKSKKIQKTNKSNINEMISSLFLTLNAQLTPLVALVYVKKIFQLSQNFFQSKKLQQILQVCSCLLVMYSAYKSNVLFHYFFFHVFLNSFFKHFIQNETLIQVIKITQYIQINI